MAAESIAYVELYASDERATAEYFVSCWGFTQVAACTAARSSSVLLRQGTAQLIVTGGPDTQEFLEEHGDGVADIAFVCDDIGRTVESSVAAGASAITLGPDHSA